VNSSRRSFLASGLALPAAGLAATAAPAATKLSYRKLGRTGLKVTTVGFGCMITSDASVIEKGADLGITYFDTARGYSGGNNERMVAGALKGKRQKLVISTKSHSRNKEKLLSDLNTSLTELNTDYVDIWYVHAVDNGSELTPEVLDALATAKKSGKARFVGASTHRGQATVLEAAIQHKLDVVLLGYNFSMDPSIEDAIAKAEQAGIGLVAMKVMAGGARRANRSTLGILQRDGAMLSALKWVLKNPHIHTTIPSMTDMEQLEENLKAMSEKFTEADRKTLTAHLDRIRPVQCRMCGHCEGACPKGLPVADEMRFLMYAEGYGQFPLARERYLELPEELRAVRCSDCSSCAVQCKFGLKVPERLGLAQQMLA
jgi:predicted aldo/keto reductase-like oxidoreductase